MANYQDEIQTASEVTQQAGNGWSAIKPEYVARMRLQNRFKTGLDIAKYTAAIMRRDMAEYDADPANYTQSLGCWHGFVGQQKLIAIKNTIKPLINATYTYQVDGSRYAFRIWSSADQSMHEKTSVPKLIEELYTFLNKPMHAN